MHSFTYLKYCPIITASATALKVRLFPWLGRSKHESFRVKVEVSHALTSASSTNCSDASEGLTSMVNTKMGGQVPYPSRGEFCSDMVDRMLAA